MSLFDDGEQKTPAAGWYPHNSRRDLERYWDGSAWTDQTRKRKGKSQHYVSKEAMAELRSPTPKEAREAEKAKADAKIACPHCGAVGAVTTSYERKKHGISGGKATGAILTAGLSLFATGLARKGWVTKLVCGNCKMRWEVE